MQEEYLILSCYKRVVKAYCSNISEAHDHFLYKLKIMLKAKFYS